MFLLSSGRPMELLFGEALPLLADAIRLQAIHLRADPDRGAQSQLFAGLAAGRWQRKEVRVPHFVPWLPQDDAVTAGSKRRSVCLEATPSTRLREALLAPSSPLRRVPGAHLRPTGRSSAPAHDRRRRAAA